MQFKDSSFAHGSRGTTVQAGSAHSFEGKEREPKGEILSLNNT